MSLLKLCGFALAAAMLALALKAGDKQLSLCLSLSAGAMLLLSAVNGLSAVLQSLGKLLGAANINRDALALIVKLMGMAYITEFSVQACRDAAQEGIALKLLLCAKIAMVILVLPLLEELSSLVIHMVP